MTDRSVVIRLRGDITDFVSKMRAAGASAKDSLGGHLDKVEGDRKRALNDLGNTAGKIGLVAAAGLGLAVRAAANFDQAMSHVAATGDDARANIDALRAAALQAGADTAFSATEAAAGVEALAKAGVSAKDTLGGGLTGALNLAAAGTMDVQAAAEAAASAMTQFGLAGKDVPHIADLLAAGAGKAQGEVSDMAMALGQSGVVASQMGLSIEETVGTLAEFAHAGLIGSDAGTSFKTMLLALNPKSEDAAKAMDALGISAFDSQGSFIGMTEFAGKLRDALDEMGDSQRNATLQTIFGTDAIRAAGILYKGGADSSREWIDGVQDAGFAADAASIKMDNLNGDLEKLRGSLETALIGTGAGAQGPLRSLVQGATDAVNAFNNLPPAAGNVAAGLLAITAVTGGAAFFGSKIIQGIANTRNALMSLGVSAGQAKAAMVGIGKAVSFVAIIEGLNLLDQAMDEAFNKNLDPNNLNRQLEALADGRIEGNIREISDALFQMGNASTGIDEALGKAPLIGGLISSTSEKAQEKIDAVDQALAAMVESGNGEQAAQILDQIVKMADDVGVSGDQARGSFEQYNLALDNAASASADAAAEGKNVATATDIAAEAARNSAAANAAEAASIAKSIEQMQKKREEAINGLDAELGYAQAVLDAKEAVKDNKHTFDTSTQAGIDNQRVVEQLASAWNAQTEAVKNAPGSYREARAALIKTATQLGDTKKHARELADELLEIPTRIATEVSVDADPAIAEIQRVRTYLDGLHGKSIEVNVTRRLVEQTGLPKADGGFISGPGSATSDSIPAMLSNGEYVIKAAAVNKYGVGFLHQVNAQRFAAGGYVSPSRSWSQRSTPGGGSQTLQVVGTLNTPWGPAQVEGIARAAARDEIGDSAALDRTHDRMYAKGQRG